MSDDDEPQLQKPTRPDADRAEQRPDRRQTESAPPSHRLMAIIRFLAEHTDRVIFTDHAQDRMEERDITPEQVYRGLRIGDLVGTVVPGQEAGEWKCKVVSRPRGSRKMGIVTIVVMDQHIVVKTVEWEDR